MTQTIPSSTVLELTADALTTAYQVQQHAQDTFEQHCRAGFLPLCGPAWSAAFTGLGSLTRQLATTWGAAEEAAVVLRAAAKTMGELEECVRHIIARAAAMEVCVKLAVPALKATTIHAAADVAVDLRTLFHPEGPVVIPLADHALAASDIVRDTLAWAYELAQDLDHTTAQALRALGGSNEEPGYRPPHTLPVMANTYGVGNTVVWGDLATAGTITVLVGGVGSDKEEQLPGMMERAEALYGAGGDSHAVVLWQGYDAPDGLVGGIAPGAAATGGRDLAAAYEQITRVNPQAHTVVVGHSYGSVVAAQAILAGAHPDVFLAVGSPGLRVPHVGDLGDTRVISVSNNADPIKLSNHPEAGIHGPDPNANAFGAEHWDLQGNHSSYFRDEEFLRRYAEVLNDH